MNRETLITSEAPISAQPGWNRTNGERSNGALDLKIEGLSSIAAALLEAVTAAAPAAIDLKCGIDFYDAVERFEVSLIRRALDRTGGNQTRAASLLNLKMTTLNSKIKRYDIAV
jgi:transcriptional regulator with GAF, ATPase, and Fis domain